MGDLTVTVSCASSHFTLNSDGSCPGGSFASLPLDIDIGVAPTQGNALTVRQAWTTSNATASISSNLHACGIPSCDASCCLSNLCLCAVAAGAPMWSATVANDLVGTLGPAFVSQIEAQVCLHAGAAGCPTGTTADANGLCRYPDMSCAPQPHRTHRMLILGSVIALALPPRDHRTGRRAQWRGVLYAPTEQRVPTRVGGSRGGTRLRARRERRDFRRSGRVSTMCPGDGVDEVRITRNDPAMGALAPRGNRFAGTTLFAGDQDRQHPAASSGSLRRCGRPPADAAFDEDQASRIDAMRRSVSCGSRVPCVGPVVNPR